ncbi:hypothetical protein MRX96_028247 [Rhipicephalus microplus]
MQSAQGEPQCNGDAEQFSVVSPAVRTFRSVWTPLPTYYYEDGSGPVSEQTLEPESLSEPSKPSRVQFFCVVLGIAIARLLLGIWLLNVRNLLSPYHVTPDVAYGAFERRLEIAPNTVGQRFIPRMVVHPDVDEKANRRTRTGARTRFRVAGRATKGKTARQLLMTVMTSPGTTLPVTTTGSREEYDVQFRRAVTLESYSGHVYTHCRHPKHEFYCSAFRKACVLAATNPAHVCNRGFNWFSSIKSCLASCVNGRHVSDRCYRSILFFPCTRVRACPWAVVACTAAGKNAAGAACSAQSRSATRRQLPETGSPRQLRHPYFADMQAHRGARCVNVTRCALKSHRILIGSNQFDSLDACRRACVRS